MKDKPLRIPNSDLYIQSWTIISMLEEELAERIGHKAPVRNLYVRSVNIGPALYVNVESHYGKTEGVQLISDKKDDVELFRCIESLKKLL